MVHVENRFRKPSMVALLGLMLVLLFSSQSHANPAFAREYNVSCALCHAAFPRLNSFGLDFMANNFHMPDWKEKIGTDVGDDRLVLPKMPPLAFRMQVNAQARESKAVDSNGNTEQQAKLDLQAPYLIKMMSGAPISEHMMYYFYGILAEKGGNGTVTVEDAWLTHDDVFGTGVGMMAGQFQVSDLMYGRETRLTFQDFMVYRLAGITYDRGVVFDRDIGPVGMNFGVTNGNGTSNNATLNSGGYKRPDHTFDNNSSKRIFGRIGGDIASVRVGAFGLTGLNPESTSKLIGFSPDNYNEVIFGIDLSGNIDNRIYWFTQFLDVNWDDMPSAGKNGHWNGGLVGIDYIHNDEWAYSLLYNFADASDFKDSGTQYEGLATNNLSLTTTYYFMRNVKGLIELNYDFLTTDGKKDGVGHDTKEGYVLVGFDVAL